LRVFETTLLYYILSFQKADVELSDDVNVDDLVNQDSYVDLMNAVNESFGSDIREIAGDVPPAAPKASTGAA
jgi:hypothetical protein